MNDFKRKFEEGIESDKLKIRARVREQFESVLIMVDEGFDSTRRAVVTEINRYLGDAPTRTNMRLEFRNKIAQQILTSEEIKGEGGVPIEVALVDVSGGGVVDSGAAASAEVEIVLLKGKPEGDDWTSEEFNSKIVPEVAGKKQPILAGNLPLQLQNGVAVLEDIKIRNHAIKIKPSEFMLGARVLGDCHIIKEAKTEPFILKDFRAKYYRKHPIPSLDDEVSRLVYIRRGGEIERRLKDEEIRTVEDFLIRLLTNPKGLKTTVNSQAKKWEATVRNARACLIGQRVYFYMDPEKKIGVVFNILGDVLRLHPNTLSEEQKAGLLASACANWDEVEGYDDENSLEQYLSSLSPYIDPLNPESPGGDRGNTEALEMVAGFMSFSGENGGQDSGYLLMGIDGDFGGNFNSSPIWSEIYPRLEEEELRASSMIRAKKKWRKLFIVWSVKTKRADAAPSRKKQKVD